MANNSGFVEVVSSQTYTQVQELINQLKQVAAEVVNINRNLNNSRLPSDNRGNLNQINQQQQQLNTTRQRANQLSAEEIVNQRQLRQNADLLARSNSVLAGAYGRLSAQQAIAARRLQDLTARGRSAEQSTRAYNRELRTAQREFDGLNRRVLAADRAVGRFNRNVGNYPSKAIGGIKDLVGAFGLVGGVTAFAMIAKDIFEQTRQLQGLELALKQVLGTSGDLGQTQAFLSRIANDYGIGIKELTKNYTQFYVSAKDKISGEEIQGIFESISKSAGAMGLSIENQDRAFLALTQMIGKGTIQAEELKGQLSEALPGAYEATMAAVQRLNPNIEVTGEIFAKMIKDGKVLAKDVLPIMAKELEKAYGVENITKVKTLAAETTRLSNMWTDFIKELDSGNGVVSNFFISMISGIAGAVDGFRQLIMSKESYDAAFSEDASVKGYQDMLEALNAIQDAEQRAFDANVAKEQQFFNMTESMKELNKLTEKQKELESKGRGSDPISDFFGSETEYERNEKRITVLNGLIGQREGALSAIDRVISELNPKEKESIELTKKQIDEVKRLAEALARLNDEYLKNSFRLRQMRLESEKDSLTKLLEQENQYVNDRLELESLLTSEELKLTTGKLNEEIRLSKNAYEEQVKNSKGNSKIQAAAYKNMLLDQKIAYESFNETIYKITQTSEDRILEIRKDHYKEFQDYVDKFEGEGLRFDVDPLADEFFEKQKNNLKELTERTKELRDATMEYLNSFSLGFLDESGFSGLTMFFDSALDPLTGKMQTTFEKLWEGADTTQEKFAVAFNSISEIAQQTFEFLNQNQQAYFDAQYSRLEKEKDIAIMFAGESASAKEEIEKQFENRSRAIRQREAEAQKQQAIFNAVINTAQAVVGALAKLPDPTAVPLSIAVGIIGAAQIALIAGQQVPQYALGTDNHPGGMAIVGDGGRHEVVYHPSSGFSVTPKTDTLVDLEKGSKVYPDFNSFLKNSGAMLGGIPNINLEGSGASASEIDGIMGKYFANIQTNNLNFDERGFTKSVSRKGNSTVFANKRGSSTGLST